MKVTDEPGAPIVDRSIVLIGQVALPGSPAVQISGWIGVVSNTGRFGSSGSASASRFANCRSTADWLGVSAGPECGPFVMRRLDSGASVLSTAGSYAVIVAWTAVGSGAPARNSTP